VLSASKNVSVILTLELGFSEVAQDMNPMVKKNKITTILFIGIWLDFNAL